MSTSNRFSFQCKVCSADAVYSYFGVKSCDACKVFFKRNIDKLTILKCDSDGKCQVNLCTRHICAPCRLKKCLDVGMRPDMVRGPFAKKKKHSTKLIQTTNQPQKLTTLSLLERDQSLLSKDQWTHISNLIHSYDEHNALPIGKQFMKEIENIPEELCLQIDSSKIVELVTIFYQATEPFIHANRDLTKLSIDDRSIVLRGAIDNVSCLGGGFILRQTGLITNRIFRQALENTFGTIPYNLTLTAISLLDQDISLVKLTLALFASCTSNCTIFDEYNSFIYINDYQTVSKIQNTYAELIWKYLLYRYSITQAVVRFSHLVQCITVAITIRTHLQTVQHHTDMIDSLVQKIEQQQININDN